MTKIDVATHKAVAYGDPQKDFFIAMLTKDITLIDCILDLIDNSIDGANLDIRKKAKVDEGLHFKDYRADIVLSENSFSIKDNCGGMSVDTAMNSAFHFGRPKNINPDAETKHGIGLYGIGMKRAVFKIGSEILIQSSTGDGAFVANIDAKAWAEKVDWGFELDVYDNNFPAVGTEINISSLNGSVSNDFSNSSFVAELLEAIARDYMFIMNKGFVITVNGNAAAAMDLSLLKGEKFNPLKKEYSLVTKNGESVNLEIIAGIWTENAAPDEADSTSLEIDPGWYVICNDRVILAADKTEKTGWGRNKPIGRKWHSQYKPFVGFALFSSEDPKLLPWNTTKRGVDINSEIYRQALTLVAEATKPAIQYTNTRKANVEVAERFESTAARVSLMRVEKSDRLEFPVLEAKEKKLASISYAVDEMKLQRVKEVLGNPLMSNKEAGERTFTYYFEIEAAE